MFTMLRYGSAFLLLLALAAGPAFALVLDRDDFAGITPFDFTGYDIPGGVQTYDFGPFVLDGYWDLHAFFMPIAPPVELPAPGGDSIHIVLDPPVFGFGLDVGAAWHLTQIEFYGADDVLLAAFGMEDFAEPGPSGHQGFLGFADDEGRAIHRVFIGPADCYFDNLYLEYQPVPEAAGTWGAVRNLYR